MLQMAIEEDVSTYIEARAPLRDEHGHRLVVRNGHQPERELLTGARPLPIQRPRVDNRRQGHRFTSAILPRYARRSPSLDALIPVLYLMGVSTGDFSEALAAILGEGAPTLSASSVVRLKEQWQQEYRAWQERDLTGKRYVYLWADGIYFNVRLEPDRPCVLVVIGATADGRKELVGLLDGQRKRALSWKELLLELVRRGLACAPELAVGDGGLGFWRALEEVFPGTRQQRCWVHKTANVLDKLPKGQHASAKRALEAIYLAASRGQAQAALGAFERLFGAKYPKVVASLRQDEHELLAFYGFPAAHWKHLRPTNPIESAFATVRHRTRQTKGCGSREATLSMVYKLVREAEQHWRKLDGSVFVLKLLAGARFEDGEEVPRKAA